MRIWPIDFSEFLLEAKHDSAVVSIDIGFDALDIICGTRNGSIGTLNIQTKQYKTLLRSPPGKVFDMIIHPDGNYLFTIEENACVRVWDIENKSEAFCFTSVKDPPTTVASPKRMQIFACGFSSGSLKVFDIENTTVLYECRAFNQPITKCAFIQASTILVTMSSAGHLSLHDVSSEFLQMKVIKIDSPVVYTDLAVPHEDIIFSSIGPESTCVLVWNTTSYGIRNRIPVNQNLVKGLCFITNKLLSVILENGNIWVFSLLVFEGNLVKEINFLHSSNLSCLVASKNYKFLISGGDEGMIKVLDSKMIYKNYSSYQQYIGHSNKIKSLIIIEHKSLVISVSENDGIFFWNFLGDLTFSETELLNDFDALANYGASYFKKNKQVSKIENEKHEKIENHIVEKVYQNQEKEKTELRKKIKHDIHTKCERDIDKLIMMPVEFEDDQFLNYTKGSFKPEDNSFINYKTNKEDIEQKLLFETKFTPEKFPDIIKQNSTKLKKKFVLGFSNNTRHNLLYNPYQRYFIFTVNNKVIIEYLEEQRFQVFLEDARDEISVRFYFRVFLFLQSLSILLFVLAL